MNGSKPGCPLAIVTRQGEDISPKSVQRFVSPHPNPLPRVEGTASFAQREAETCGLFCRQRTVHPLPKEQGWSEGEEARITLGVWPNPGIVELVESSGR